MDCVPSSIRAGAWCGPVACGPGLIFRFEAEDDDSLESIQDLFRQIMDFAAPNLTLPF
jgi:hypothetical protein